MEHEQILIPEGWTYFAHRTNTSKWDTNPFEGIFDGQGFDINGIYMNNAEEGRNYGLFGYINNAVFYFSFWTFWTIYHYPN